MKKLLTILGSVGLVATSGAFVIACGDKTKMNDATTTQEEKIDLNKLVKVRDLGFVSKNDKEIIKNAFIKQNGLGDPKIKDKIEVTVKSNGGTTSSGSSTTTSNGNSSDSAVIEIKNKTNGNGTKTVTVIFDVNNNLKTLVKVTKLKSLPDNKDDTILAAVAKANPKSNLDVKELKIERIDKKVLVKAKTNNQTYTDEAELQIESKVGVYVGLSLLSVALLASSGFIIYRSVKKKKKQM
ncbi:lipoprotein [Mycoplasma mycoides]|uniref:lipoprotein n=1 Tax=Mycoplasma mycoides TaxID=2102 RepID=UPI00034A4172|nr:lipoprotein [Mycoplasma mycoides]EXU60378.1 Hypothetical protein, predicted lipoprotein [Mycoplasma mycoides subsp. capri PG3]QVK04133.1 lipoprotein [Mycoplasma mycoides subsp. capri]